MLIQVRLRPFEEFEGLDWVPWYSAWELRERQIRFYCLKKSALYLPKWVRHQMADKFCFPLPSPTDMGSVAYTQARAHVATVAALEHPPRYFFRGAELDEYQNWFRLVGKPLLFLEVLRETQRGMWYCADWAKV